MAILRCTKKLLTELKTKNLEASQSPRELNSWHVNLFRLERRKCIIWTHDRTLYSFLAFGLTKPDFLNFQEIFKQELSNNLLVDKIPEKYIKLLLDDSQCIEIAKTNNRSVLGSMNDLIFQVKTQVAMNGGLIHTDIEVLNHFIKRIPMSKITETFSIDEMKRFLDQSIGIQ